MDHTFGPIETTPHEDGKTLVMKFRHNGHEHAARFPIIHFEEDGQSYDEAVAGSERAGLAVTIMAILEGRMVCEQP